MRNFFCHHLFYFVYYKTISYKSWTHIIVKGMESMLLLLRWKDQTIMIRNSWEAPTTRFISKWRPRVFWLCNLLSQCSKYYILCMTSKCHCFIKIHTETVLSPDHFFHVLRKYLYIWNISDLLVQFIYVDNLTTQLKATLSYSFVYISRNLKSNNFKKILSLK